MHSQCANIIESANEILSRNEYYLNRWRLLAREKQEQVLLEVENDLKDALKSVRALRKNLRETEG